MNPRQWLLAADKKTLVNLDHVAWIGFMNNGALAAELAVELGDGDRRIVLQPAATSELGFAHLRSILLEDK